MDYKHKHSSDQPVLSDDVHHSIFWGECSNSLSPIQKHKKSFSKNVFDELPALAAPQPSDLHDKLGGYLSSDPEHIMDVLSWWFKKQHTYPALSHMAMDYHMIPSV